MAHSHSENLTYARPYSRAAFNYASEHKALAAWDDALSLWAAAAAYPAMQPLLGNNPNMTPEKLTELFAGLAKETNDAQRNFLRLLAENRRLEALPAISDGFKALRAAAEGRITVNLRAASKVADDQAKKISAALSKRLDRKVELTTEVDESLLGGAVIRAGDLVIDKSVRGKLERLATELMH
ncbi:MAG TPA: F0F1 ATP synthase subunit delta [Gammaproteobacteria bacterium]|nr:F0F1 ATP synthase subunit delta [Gammaproteobacteria bacterium]